MTQERTQQFRRLLDAMDRRLQGDIDALQEVAGSALGTDTGDLSGAPMHLADLGTEQYLQELSATLFENEEYIRLEVRDAIGRIDRNTYGLCERCGATVPEERLEVIPYTRYCTRCSAEVGDGATANLNAGRPARMDGLERRHQGGEGDHQRTRLEDPDQPFTDAAPEPERPRDVHAAGTAGGGTAVGGLAGTNIGEGDPDEGDLEDALGSGKYDQDLDDDHEDTSTYSGPTGGAVGGSVADLRSVGGKTGKGLSPAPDPGDSPVGP